MDARLEWMLNALVAVIVVTVLVVLAVETGSRVTQLQAEVRALHQSMIEAGYVQYEPRITERTKE